MSVVGQCEVVEYGKRCARKGNEFAGGEGPSAWICDLHLGRISLPPVLCYACGATSLSFYHYSAPSYQCQKRANTGEFGRKRLRLSQPCRTYVPMQPNNDEPTATTEPPDVARSLALHKRWLHGKEGGEHANLRYADLRSANLRYANLSSANLRYANLESARLPDGVRWWQGGAYGPRRRMLRVWRINADIYAQAGCIHGSPDQVLAAIQYRRDDWAGELGADAAQTELDRFAVLMSVALDQLG